MSRTTGPILTVGAITFVNRAVLGNERDDVAFGARVAVGTGVAALMLAGAERVNEDLAVGVAWLALLGAVLAPIRGEPSPAQRALAWWNKTA